MSEKAKKTEKWVAAVGIDHGGRRYDPGDAVPKELAEERWLVEQKLIKKAGDNGSSAR